MHTTRTYLYSSDRDPPGQRLPLWTEAQTGVKTLPYCNFIAGGDKLQANFAILGITSKTYS